MLLLTSPVNRRGDGRRLRWVAIEMIYLEVVELIMLLSTVEYDQLSDCPWFTYWWMSEHTTKSVDSFFPIGRTREWNRHGVWVRECPLGAVFIKN